MKHQEKESEIEKKIMHLCFKKKKHNRNRKGINQKEENSKTYLLPLLILLEMFIDLSDHCVFSYKIRLV
jgi:hypothetical protein